MKFHFKGDDYLRVVRQITPAASKDEQRPALNVVKIECVDEGPGPKVLRFLSTDSYVLAAAVIEADCEDSTTDWEAYVDARDLAETVAGKTKEIKKFGIDLDFDPNGAWTYEIGEFMGRFISPREMCHPNYQKLFDSVEGISENDPLFSLGVRTLPYLAALARADTEHSLDFYADPSRPAQPLLIRQGNTFSALVMPVKSHPFLRMGFAEVPPAGEYWVEDAESLVTLA